MWCATCSALSLSTGSEDLAAARAAVQGPPVPRISCDFTLAEVLSGKARVFRMMGEHPALYRERLKKRLNGLLVLVTQIQNEVDERAIEVKDARDQVTTPPYLLASF
jgi:hypothetical protein